VCYKGVWEVVILWVSRVHQTTRNLPVHLSEAEWIYSSSQHVFCKLNWRLQKMHLYCRYVRCWRWSTQLRNRRPARPVSVMRIGKFMWTTEWLCKGVWLQFETYLEVSASRLLPLKSPVIITHLTVCTRPL